MPYGIPITRVERDEVAASISGKNKASCGCEESTATAAVELMPPRDLSGFRVYRGEVVAERSQVERLFSSQAHGSSGIRVGEIEHIESVILSDVEQTCI